MRSHSNGGAGQSAASAHCGARAPGLGRAECHTCPRHSYTQHEHASSTPRPSPVASGQSRLLERLGQKLRHAADAVAPRKRGSTADVSGGLSAELEDPEGPRKAPFLESSALTCPQGKPAFCISLKPTVPFLELSHESTGHWALQRQEFILSPPWGLDVRDPGAGVGRAGPSASCVLSVHTAVFSPCVHTDFPPWAHASLLSPPLVAETPVVSD